MIQAATLKFLRSLAKNNNKPWFDAHRSEYEIARKDFELFLQSVIDGFGKIDSSIAPLEARQCMFRINRDVRFSKNKMPYKINFGASINRGGRKSIYAGYYFHLEPRNSFAGGGLWMPMPAETHKVRQEIDYCWDEFGKMLRSKSFKSLYGDFDNDPGVSLVNVPRGYDKDNPAAQYLKLKSWTATCGLTNSELTDKTLVKKTIQAFKVLQPFIDFMNRAIED